MLDFRIDEALCNRCKECVRDCPSRAITFPKKGVPELIEDAEDVCIHCQHCLAVCPTGAISIEGKRPENSLELDPADLPSLDAMELLVKGRRTTRRYKKEAVDPELIKRLLADIEHAPTGANRRALTFTVVDVAATRQGLMEALQAASEGGNIPEHFAYINAAVPAYFKYKADLIFRGAPHLLVVSAGPGALCPKEDITIALTTFELLAAAAGLGTTWCGMLTMALETVPEQKTAFNLGEAQNYYGMLFGLPAVTYARTVQRGRAESPEKKSEAAGKKDVPVNNPDVALDSISDALDSVIPGSDGGSDQVPWDEGDNVSNTDSDVDGIPDAIDRT